LKDKDGRESANIEREGSESTIISSANFSSVT
jgi:hypothetical protein